MVINEEIKTENTNVNLNEVSDSDTLSDSLSFVETDNTLVSDNVESNESDLLPPSDIENEFLDEWDEDDNDDDDDLDGFELPEGFENEPHENQAQNSTTETVIEDADTENKANDENNSVETAESVETVATEETVGLDNSSIDVSDGWATNNATENLDSSDEAYNELENVREITSDVNSDFADLSYLANVKKKDEEISEKDLKDAKRKAQEEKKRKRKEENDLFARRYQAKSINAAVAQSDPIIYFYNAILDKTGSIRLFNVYQVLQDRFVGKLVPQLWTAVAESSDRILDLNMANLVEQLKICEQYPMYEFVLTMSTRFFTKSAVLEKMLALIEKPIPNLVMAFDCVSLQNLGAAAKTGLGQVKAKGVKIILDNTEKVSMTTLSELEFDYLRIDSRYYELGNFKSEGFLRLLTGWANELGIPTIAMYCDHNDMAEYMLYMGIDLVQGNSISRPMRTVPNAVKAITLSDSMQGN